MIAAREHLEEAGGLITLMEERLKTADVQVVATTKGEIDVVLPSRASSWQLRAF